MNAILMNNQGGGHPLFRGTDNSPPSNVEAEERAAARLETAAAAAVAAADRLRRGAAARAAPTTNVAASAPGLYLREGDAVPSPTPATSDAALALALAGGAAARKRGRRWEGGEEEEDQHEHSSKRKQVGDYRAPLFRGDDAGTISELEKKKAEMLRLIHGRGSRPASSEAGPQQEEQATAASRASLSSLGGLFGSPHQRIVGAHTHLNPLSALQIPEAAAGLGRLPAADEVAHQVATLKRQQATPPPATSPAALLPLAASLSGVDPALIQLLANARAEEMLVSVLANPTNAQLRNDILRSPSAATGRTSAASGRHRPEVDAVQLAILRERLRLAQQQQHMPTFLHSQLGPRRQDAAASTGVDMSALLGEAAGALSQRHVPLREAVPFLPPHTGGMPPRRRPSSSAVAVGGRLALQSEVELHRAAAWPSPPAHGALPRLIALPDEDEDTLSSYQCLLRRQIEVFAAGDEDVKTHARGRNKPVVRGQVGIRCRHCRGLAPSSRQRGSTYFPSTLLGLYQAAQNMATFHISSETSPCAMMPPEVKAEFDKVFSCKSTVGGGKQYWANAAKKMGLMDTQNGIFFNG